MEKIKVCYVNFDFDYQLSKENFSISIEPESNINNKLRYLFFWSCSSHESLFSFDKTYCEKYKLIIKKYRNIDLLTSDKSDGELSFWWGDCSTEEKWKLEKKINSKFVSAQVENELGMSSKSIIKDFEVSDLCENKLLKKEHGFTGRGFVKSKNFKGPVLIEELFDRVNDYGTIIDANKKVIFRNFVSQTGQYVGSHFSKDYKNELSEVLEVQTNIFHKYKQKFNISKLQIDSFTYLDGGKVCWRYLCEVNHRRSIGQLAYKIHTELGNQESLFILIPLVNKFVTSELVYNEKEKSGILKLSHETEKMQCFLITAKTTQEIRVFFEESKLANLVPIIKL